MTYQPNKPQATDFLSQSAQDIQSNFNVANQIMAIDHYPFDNLSSNKGYHKQVHMPEQAAPSTAVNVGALYCNVGTNPSETNLFFRAESSGHSYQLTRVKSASTALFGANAAYGNPPAGFTQTGGWTFLPGGLFLMYGFYGQTGSTGLTGTVEFPIAFTNPAYSVTAVAVRPSGAQTLENISVITATDFTFKMSGGGNDGLYWQAIGN